MPPHLGLQNIVIRSDVWNGSWKNGLTVEGFIIESWSQGFLVGALLIMAATTVANMRKDFLLHKLILLEVRYHPFCEVDQKKPAN